MRYLRHLRQFFKFFCFLLFLFFAGNVSANVGLDYGFGSRVMGLSGIGVVGECDPYAAYHNPALLSCPTDKTLQFSYGLVIVKPRFLGIGPVTTQNTFTSDKTVQADVDTDYKATFGQEVGFSYRILPDTLALTFGVASFFPLDQLAYVDTGQPYVPEYVLYRARTQRPQVEFGLGADLGYGIHLGFGLHTAFSMTSDANVFMGTSQKDQTSTMTFASSLSPKVAPYFGIYFKPQEEKSRFSVGAVFRVAADSENSMALNSNVKFGPTGNIPLKFTAESALYYDPQALELGMEVELIQGIRLMGQLDYQWWSRFKAPALDINPSEESLQISPGILPAYAYRNIYIPRVGLEIPVYRLNTVTLSYAYRPSIFEDLPSGNGNYLDPSKSIIGLACGLDISSFLHLKIPTRLDLNLTYHYFPTQSITKTAGNEAGIPSDVKIGSPGYRAGGNLLGGGLSLSMAI